MSTDAYFSADIGNFHIFEYIMFGSGFIDGEALLRTEDQNERLHLVIKQLWEAAQISDQDGTCYSQQEVLRTIDKVMSAVEECGAYIGAM